MNEPIHVWDRDFSDEIYLTLEESEEAVLVEIYAEDTSLSLFLSKFGVTELRKALQKIEKSMKAGG